VDLFPSMKHIPSWFPGAGFRKHAAKARIQVAQMVDQPFEEVKRAMAEGKALPSVTASLLNDTYDTNEDSTVYDYTVKWASGTLYGAATESTAACISTFFLAMAMHPEVQAKAHAEIDSVIGTGRLPLFSDKDQLPFINAIVNETLRWQPPTASGIPHRVTADDHYNGYRIPEGSIVIPNIWGMGRDPEHFRDPHAYLPERYLQTDSDAVLDPQSFVFGFGRRSCPGVHYAMNILFITMANILAVFDIKAQDEHGRDVPVSAQFTPGFVTHAAKFPCCIIPRSKAAVDLIQSS